MNVGRIPQSERQRAVASGQPVGNQSHSAIHDSVTTLLTRASTAPAALLVSGEAGIGKSTRWLAAVARAEECGFTVLSARAAVDESDLAYATLADLLGGVDPAIWSNLPLPQRDVLNLILLSDDRCGEGPDRRTAAAAVSAVVQRLTETAPVLVAIDDLQWIDPASAGILAFVTRRLTGPVGVLTTIRTGGSSSPPVALDLPPASNSDRITLLPLTLGALHSMLSRRLGRSLPRPTLVRIHDISGGNPFYALELALALPDPAGSGSAALPGTLTDVVRSRVGPLGAEVRHVLLIAAALIAPTVASIARAVGTEPAEVVGLLECAEDAGIVRIDGERLHFVHPLLARGIYSAASSAVRRSVHRSVAEGTDDPELRARHLALGSAVADPGIVRLLGSAADSARRRGAQALAAELHELAAGLGGDTPARRIRTASCHLAAGDVSRARAVLAQTLAALAQGPQRMYALSVLARIHLYDDSFTAAGDVLRQGLAESGERSTARVRMMLANAFVQRTGGALEAAIVSTEVAAADAIALGEAGLHGQACAFRVVLATLTGEGFDAADLQRTSHGDDSNADADAPLPLRSTMNHVLLRSWTGQLDRARADVAALARQSRDRGDEHEQVYAGFHGAVVETWRGDFAAAAEIAHDLTVRAEQLGGDIPRAMAATTQAVLDAYAGRVHEARENVHVALDASRRCGADSLSRSALTTLAFLESSLGDHTAVLTVVKPMLAADAAKPRATEIVTAAYLPDAIEALISLGQFDEADVLVDRLERNGRRLDRAWMLAVGGRCRAMLCAARGELDAAGESIGQAMMHHDRLPMPFERARSQLVLGQLQRRNRRKDVSNTTLSAALATFQDLGAQLWADRTRTELERSNPVSRNSFGLTTSERAVAELAATGMINRDVATTLFISPKTVEAHLARVYRKLNIRSRAELGRHMSHVDQAAPVAGLR